MPFNCLFLLFGVMLSAVTYAAEVYGIVDAVYGEAAVIDSAGTATPVAQDQRIEVGTTLHTGPDGEVHVVTVDQGFIALRPDSIFMAERYQARGEASDIAYLQLLKGALRSITGWIGKRDKTAYRLATPAATIGIRGTDHETTVLDEDREGDAAGTYETVYEGITVMANAHGEVEVHPGQYAHAPRDGSAAPSILSVPPKFTRDRVLKLEERIATRKENLRKRLAEQLTEAQVEKLQDIRSGWENMTDAQRSKMRKHARRVLQNRRNKD